MELYVIETSKYRTKTLFDREVSFTMEEEGRGTEVFRLLKKLLY